MNERTARRRRGVVNQSQFVHGLYKNRGEGGTYRDNRFTVGIMRCMWIMEQNT